MYLIPLIAIVVLGLLAVAWNPIFVLIFFALFMVGFFAFVGLRPRADEQLDHEQQLPNQKPRTEDDRDSGLWGERRA